MSRLHSAALVLAALVLGCDARPSDSAQTSAVQAPPSTQAAADAAGANKVLDPMGFSDQRVRLAYDAAKQYAHVLEQIYCYCHCKESAGHRSLLTCFQSEHGSGCDVCIGEAELADQMVTQGKSLQEIQAQINVAFGR